MLLFVKQHEDSFIFILLFTPCSSGNSSMEVGIGKLRCRLTLFKIVDVVGKSFESNVCKEE